jgi:hypothetical protein
MLRMEAQCCQRLQGARQRGTVPAAAKATLLYNHNSSKARHGPCKLLCYTVQECLWCAAHVFGCAATARGISSAGWCWSQHPHRHWGGSAGSSACHRQTGCCPGMVVLRVGMQERRQAKSSEYSGSRGHVCVWGWGCTSSCLGASKIFAQDSQMEAPCSSLTLWK